MVVGGGSYNTTTGVFANSDVLPVDLATGRAGKPIVLPGGGAGFIAIAPDGKTAYMTGDNNGGVIPIDLVTDRSGKPISIPYDDDDGDGAYAIAMASNTSAWVTGAASGTLVRINLSTRTFGKPIHVPGRAGIYEIAITPDGKTAYVTNNGVGVVPINLRTRTVGKPVTVRPDAGDIAIAS
jgi:DNA-binding beta-propeller fold protein YncE